MSLQTAQAARHLRWDLISYKALSSLQSETNRSRLGVIWWVLDPLLYMSVFYIVFGVIFERGGPGFVAKLLIALVIWRWFDNSVKTASGSLINGVGLMRQVYVSKLLFPMAAMFAQSLKFLCVLLILLVFLLAYGVEPGSSWLGLVPILLAELAFIAGLGLLLAAVIPFFPDLKTLIDYGIQLGFFMSGVFYEIASVPEAVRGYFALNPMAVLIDQSRQVLLYNNAPDWFALGWIALLGGALAVLGSYLLSRFDRDYPNLLL
ncbi:MAG: ABC transporter permease [Halieaceae bacterium]